MDTDALKAELERLKREGRREVAELLNRARATGKMSSQPEYREAQAKRDALEREILRLEEQLLLSTAESRRKAPSSKPP